MISDLPTLLQKKIWSHLLMMEINSRRCDDYVYPKKKLISSNVTTGFVQIERMDPQVRRFYSNSLGIRMMGH